MSLTTGYQDMLIQVRWADTVVDALSPAGFRWMAEKYGSTKAQRVSNRPQVIGNLVAEMLAARLTIAVRSDTMQTVVDEAGNSYSAKEIELRPDAHIREEPVPEMPARSNDDKKVEDVPPA